MSAEEDDWVGIHQVATSDDSGIVGRGDHVFDVTCNNIGEQVLTIFVFNKATSKNKFPAESSTTTRYVHISFVSTTFRLDDIHIFYKAHQRLQLFLVVSASNVSSKYSMYY